MKELLTALGIFTTFSLFAQDISQTLVAETPAHFCTPGVSKQSPGKGLLASYMTYPSFALTPPNSESESEVSHNERLNFKIKIPCVNIVGMKLLVGFQYMRERYNFSQIQPENYPLFERLNTVNLKTARGAIYLSKSLNETNYLSFALGTTYSGDYDKFVKIDKRYAIYRAVGLLGVKRNEDFEFGFGMLFTKSFRRTLALPFGFYNRTFNDNWGIEFAIPVRLMGRYNIKDGSLILFGTEYVSRSYSIDVMQPEAEIFHFRRAAIEFSATWQKRFTNWTWMEFKLGYAMNRNSRVDDVNARTEFRINPTNGIFGTISFFISPPDHLCK